MCRLCPCMLTICIYSTLGYLPPPPPPLSLSHTHTHTHTLSLSSLLLPSLSLSPLLTPLCSYIQYFHQRLHFTTPPCCRPTEFLPHEYSGIRGIEQKMYKEQEILKMKSHKDIKAAYNTYCAKLPSYDCVFFPARVSSKSCCLCPYFAYAWLFLVDSWSVS